jgi:anionic cell wall polymer biosynthesis LytR-Cps2A-Psr (LCP) family protein
VDFHLVLDEQGFARIIDMLGGVNIYVEEDMDYEDPYQDLFIHIRRGYQTLDGVTAMKYLRFRDDELGDIGRVLRQQRFIKVFADKVFSFSGLLQLPHLKNVLEQSINTDLSLPDALRMLQSLRSYGKEAVRFEMLPGDPLTINGKSYWLSDQVKVRETLDALGIAYIK